MTNAERLSQFGKDLIENVRNRTIQHFNMVENGKIKSATGQELHQQLTRLNDSELALFQKLVVTVIDETLFKTLFLFEGDDWTVIEKDLLDKSGPKGLSEISDGLSGELFGTNGWIARYGKKQ